MVIVSAVIGLLVYGIMLWLWMWVVSNYEPFRNVFLAYGEQIERRTSPQMFALLIPVLPVLALLNLAWLWVWFWCWFLTNFTPKGLVIEPHNFYDYWSG